jgi:heat shock protein HslJ
MIPIRVWLAGAGILALTACQTAPEPKQDPEPKTENPTPVASAAGVAGQWMLIDDTGRPVSHSPDSGITLRAGRKHILMQSQCIYFYWTYQAQPDGRFVAQSGSWKVKSPDPMTLVRPMCARGLHPQESRVSAAISNAERFTLDSPDRLTLMSGNTQISFRRRPDIEGAWQVQNINGTRAGERDYVIQVSAGGGDLRAESQCVQWFWRYRLDTQRMAISRALVDTAVCERSFRPFERAFQETVEVARVWTFDADRNLRLAGSKGQIVLEPLGAE